MTSSALFLDEPVKIDGAEKHAGMLSKLSDNSDLWPQEIMQEAYKQLPYLSDFEPNVILDKVNDERGFAFGSIEVRPKTAQTMEEMEESPIQKVHVPVVVKEGMLSPLDIFNVGKKFYFLTEGRLRTALFRPDTFDAVRTRPFDPSLINELHPPIRAGYGGFGSGGTKVGSAHLAPSVPILPQLGGTVLPQHMTRLEKAASDPSVQAAILNADEGVQAAFQSALQQELSDPEKTAQVVKDSIRPTVVQFQKLASGDVKVKWASADMYAPQEEVMPMSSAQDLAGDVDLSQQLEGDGTFTVSPDSAVKETLENEEISVVDQFGLWQVQDLQGNTLVGWVFPRVMSLDMTPLPLSLFTNGSQHALQERVAGQLAGKSADIPKGVPKGYGALYYIDHGTAKAMVPMNITGTLRGPDGNVSYRAQTDLGDEVSFSFADGLKAVVQVGEDEYLIPQSFSWMPLRGKTELVPEPAMFSKVASVGGSGGNFTGTIEIVGDGDIFSLRGAPLAKVAEDQTKFIKRAEAEFLGVALGIHQNFIKEALDRAADGQLVKVENLRTLGSPKEKWAAAVEKVKGYLDDLEVPIRNYDLVKEASFLDDALTADRVLGLGFINAENVSTFVDMLPGLEATSSKLAELLLAVRIGLKDIPEVAVERMLAALEDVIRGLKALQQREYSFTD